MTLCECDAKSSDRVSARGPQCDGRVTDLYRRPEALKFCSNPGTHPPRRAPLVITPISGPRTMLTILDELRRRVKAHLWQRRGSVPGASGSTAAMWFAVEKGIRANLSTGYGQDDVGLDERVVEYPWLFHRMSVVDRPGG